MTKWPVQNTHIHTQTTPDTQNNKMLQTFRINIFCVYIFQRYFLKYLLFIWVQNRCH